MSVYQRSQALSIFASYARLSSRCSNITHHISIISSSMKSGIHPTYFQKATITCSCSAVFEAGSTVENMKTEICSQCHPFYTGKKKFIDATGRVDRFKQLTKKSEEKMATRLKTVKTKTASKSASASEATADKKEKKSVKQAA